MSLVQSSMTLVSVGIITIPQNFLDYMRKFVSCHVCLKTILMFNTNLCLNKLYVNHYVLGELHLLLRISDILLRNLIFDSKDKEDKYEKETKCNGKNLEKLVEVIQSCGVSFYIWVPKGSLIGQVWQVQKS